MKGPIADSLRVYAALVVPVFMQNRCNDSTKLKGDALWSQSYADHNISSEIAAIYVMHFYYKKISCPNIGL